MTVCIGCGKELGISCVCKDCSKTVIKGPHFVSLLCPYCGETVKPTNPGLFGREWKCTLCGEVFYLEEL